ncbi:hypothetical protein NDA13_006274 [Ustilago tritici]|nr:hypothetical protein NDA13_006274 [Ustilago tritici]
MVSPTIELFSTSILSNVKVRTRHERFTSVFAIKKIPYIYHDLASDDDAKSRWRRKAKDPQLPGILVNNEWVGSYDEFEEAVEFGELEVLLGVSPAAAQATPPAPHPAQSAVSSKDPSLYPTLPYAAEGAGRWKEPDADQFISSLNIKEEELNDDDVDALLAEIGKLPADAATRSEKKYVPSKEAAIKPLRLAKMGATTSHQRMPSGSPSPSAASAATRASPVARYSATQRSTRALAAEAAALTSNRKTSGALLRDAVSQGKTLDDAMEESRMKHIVSQDNMDDLFASLGLSNVDIGDDEVDQFLEQGAIPQGLGLGGERVHRPSSVADKARDEAVARDLALKAKEKGHGSARSSLAHESTSKSAALAGPAPASQIGTSVDDASAERSTASGGTSTLSAQPSNVTEATLETPEWKGDEAAEAVEREKEVVKLEAEAPKQSLAAAPEEGEEEAETTKVVGDEPAKKADDEDQSSEPAEIKAKVERPILEEPSPLSTNAEMTKTDVVDTEEVEEEKATPGASTSNRKVDVPPQDSESIPKEAEEAEEAEELEAALSTLLPAKNHVSGDEKRAASEPNKDLRSVTLSSDANEPVSSRSSKWEQSARSGAHDSTTASKGLSLSSSTSNEILDKADIDQDRTPTKEIWADPIQLEGESIAKAETKRQEAEKARNGEASELELAQAAMIASKYQNRKSGLPLQFQSIVTVDGKDEEAPLEPWTITSRSSSSSSLLSKDPEVTSPAKSLSSSAAAITSPVHIPVCQESKEGSSSLTSPLPLGLGARGQPPSRQASSGSVSSSRRAIDVSRPIDPSISPTSPLPPLSSSELFMSPETLAKKKRVGLFGLGKDKDKERDKTTANDKNSKAAAASEAAAASGAAPSTSRHERTISQILREADAVLQMGGQGSDNDQEDETEDPTMFGSSSVDI